MAGRHRKPPSRHHRGRHRQPPSSGRWIAPTLATLAVLAAGGVSAYSALNGGGGSAPDHFAVSSSPTTLATTIRPVTAGPATSAPSVAPTPKAASHPTPARGKSAALRLVVTGRVSWVEVIRPTGHVVFSGLLRHGHALTYRHGPVHVVVGDAGAVRLDRNGHRRAPLGKAGQVVRFTVR
jgi:hypothetical protein